MAKFRALAKFNAMNEVSQRTERVRTIFLDTQSFFASQDNMQVLLQWLENIEPVFRSIAYESASMAIALKDIEEGNGLDAWLYYANGPATAHKAQVYIGLGLAIAQSNCSLSTILEKIDPLLYHRVVDGCGYYDGSFRQRRTVLSQQLPAYLPGSVLQFYDQGVGRSLWYTFDGDINKICSRVESFPAGRQPGLWRGVGIAVAYVGGCDEKSLETLSKYVASNDIQLAYGAALAVRSRATANTMTADTDQCSRFWYTLTAGKKNRIGEDPGVPAKIKDETIYMNWIKQVEEELAGSFNIMES